jgi:uncharacterized protein
MQLNRLGIFGIAALAAGFALAVAPAVAADQSFDRGTHGVVEIETSNAYGASGQITADLASLLDDGATRRIVSVQGDGSLQNILDLKALHGIDLAIVQADALDYARQQKLMAGIETITYVARLYNEEFHLLARAEVKTIADLAGKKVDFGPPGGGTLVTAGKVFAALGIAVSPSYQPTALALAKLAKGEIAAVALVAAKPAPAIRALDGANGLHLLSVPLRGALTASYAPTRLAATDYPGLVPANGSIDTVAVGAVLAAANLAQGSERQHNVASFVEALFTQFPALLEPGHNAKWHEVNLAAALPGWRRYPAAEQWLQRNTLVQRKRPAPQDLKAMFERFLDERLKLMGTAMTQQQKDALFDQFERWQNQSAAASSDTSH